LRAKISTALDQKLRVLISCNCALKMKKWPLPHLSRPIEKGIPGPGFLAHVLVSKYADHLPLYRQAQIFAREGLDMDRSALAG
jgi:transposase